MPHIKHPYIVDVEASGFGLDSYPIEVGLALESGVRYCALIKPQATWTHWDESAENLHGISREILASKGKAIVEVAKELNAFLQDGCVFSDAWGVDEPWIIRLFEAAGLERTFRIYDIQTIMTEEQMDCWHATKDSVINDLNLSRHRASNDARVIQETYNRSW